jgi:hypothetical protein
MKMKKILTEWRRFVIKEALEKTNLEKKIEAAWPHKYNEVLADVKAAAHAARFLNGGSVNNLEDYLNRVEFGKTAKERIQSINRNSEQFADMFTAIEVYRPVYDKRFLNPDGTAPEKTFTGIGIVPTFIKFNFSGSDKEGVLTKAKTEEQAYTEFFQKFEQLDQMLDKQDYNFLQQFGKMTGKTNMDIRHSGGAASTGLLIVPSEATDEEQEVMMQSYLFYSKHANDPAYVMAIKAEEELQNAIEIALSLWRKYGGFKDGADIQANKGAWLRMNRALEKSRDTVKKIKNNPKLFDPKKRKGYADIQGDLGSPKQSELPSEPQDEYGLAMSTPDKELATKIMTTLKTRGDKRWRDIRTRTRSM